MAPNAGGIYETTSSTRGRNGTLVVTVGAATQRLRAGVTVADSLRPVGEGDGGIARITGLTSLVSRK